jgi:hypothetical protein
MELYDYWNESPPVHEMVAGYLGVHVKRKPPQKQSTEEEIRAFAALLGIKE